MKALKPIVFFIRNNHVKWDVLHFFSELMDYGSKMVSKIRIFTNNVIIIVPNFLGNQGWPSVAYNEQIDEYMIAFQFRAGASQYFSNKYIIISQRVQSARTERAAGPSLLVKANGQGGRWVDAMGPLIKYNLVTGKNQAPVVQKVDCANPIGFPNTYPPDSDLSGG